MAKPIFSFVTSLLFLASTVHAADRVEFAIVGGKINQVIPITSFLPLSISNDYGPITVHFVDNKRDSVVITGTYASDSKNHATIQHLIRSSANRIFIDGPAKFKSHDHVGKYGKPLDYDFFAANVGRYNIAEGTENEGDLEVGTSYTIKKSGGASMHGRNTFWGAMSWGGKFSMDEGASIDREAAQVTLVVEIPIHLADKVTIDAEGQPITVGTPSDVFEMEKSGDELVFTKKSAHCTTRVQK